MSIADELRTDKDFGLCLRAGRYLRVIAVLVLMATILFFIIDSFTSKYSSSFLIHCMREILRQNVFLVIIYFLLGATFLALVGFPFTLLSCAAGFIFASKLGLALGIFVSTFVNTLSLTIAAAICYLIVSKYFKDEVLALAEQSGIIFFKGLENALVTKGFRINLLLRLSPVVPYQLLNFVVPALGTSFKDYSSACGIGVFAHCAPLCVIGASLHDLSAIASYTRHAPRALVICLFLILLIFLILSTVLLFNHTKHILQEIETMKHDGDQADSALLEVSSTASNAHEGSALLPHTVANSDIQNNKCNYRTW